MIKLRGNIITWSQTGDRDYLFIYLMIQATHFYQQLYVYMKNTIHIVGD